MPIFPSEWSDKGFSMVDGASAFLPACSEAGATISSILDQMKTDQSSALQAKFQFSFNVYATAFQNMSQFFANFYDLCKKAIDNSRA